MYVSKKNIQYIYIYIYIYIFVCVCVCVCVFSLMPALLIGFVNN